MYQSNPTMNPKMKVLPEVVITEFYHRQFCLTSTDLQFIFKKKKDQLSLSEKQKKKKSVE